MGLLIQDIDVSNAIKAIRELILDVSPVTLAKVKGQGFSISKTNSDVVIDGVSTPITEVEKVYEYMELLREKITVEEDLLVVPTFVATEYTASIRNFTKTFTAENTEYFELKRSRYFSDESILTMMLEYYTENLTFNESPSSVETVYKDLNYMDKRKLILWCAYYLVDRKRMLYASAQAMMALQEGNEEAYTGNTLTNQSRSVTAKIGDTFIETLTDNDGGKGLDGFTSLWGDQYSYLAKLQLWIRERFEKQFKDFSLRDDCLVSSNFVLEKSWTPDGWLDSTNLSTSTIDLIN